jgi:hypothetical protein
LSSAPGIGDSVWKVVGMEDHSTPAKRSTASAMRWEDWSAYGFLLAGVYFLVGTLFFYAGKEKIFD